MNFTPDVPAIAATVSVRYESAPYPADGRHTTVVLDDQDAEEQVDVLPLNVALKSAPPKFKPVTVILCPAEVGILAREWDADGASKLNVVLSVPAIALTVKNTAARGDAVSCQLHCTVVDDVQADVAHAPSAIICDGLKSELPKFKPCTLTVSRPLAGTLRA